ncbi:MAG: hypothetical protein HYR89_03960 [Actinobacteria bacterium]|nr:hypothetical protein [Actinomycetota bacterium]
MDHTTEIEDFGHPSEYVSRSTLDASGSTNAGLLMDEARRVVGSDSEAWFTTLDPAITTVLAHADDGVPDLIEAPLARGRTTERHVAHTSTRAGYWMGRMVLQTGHAPLLWSSDPDADTNAVRDTVDAIDIRSVMRGCNIRLSIAAPASHREGVCDSLMKIPWDEQAAERVVIEKLGGTVRYDRDPGGGAEQVRDFHLETEQAGSRSRSRDTLTRVTKRR